MGKSFCRYEFNKNPAINIIDAISKIFKSKILPLCFKKIVVAILNRSGRTIKKIADM